jgi:hypothetical protein
MPESIKPEEHNPKNIYEKEKFSPEEAKERLESLVSDFKKYYSGLGYIEEEPVLISSGVDPTVRFIGSHISVFKPYLAEDRVPSPGVFMRQDCIRTRNADGLLDDGYSSNWGSYFPSIGALTPAERLPQACNEAFDFCEGQLGVSPENLLIRINSGDEDLMSVCVERYGEKKLEVDSKKPEYYRHKLGIDGVWGRNFNIAFKDPKGDNFSDIGNIIVIENAEKKLGVEVALGTTTILKQLYGLDHVQDCTPVIGLKSENEAQRRKFEDAIITSTVLYREGLRPLGQNNRNRILKQYVRSLSYFRAKSGLSVNDLSNLVSDFEKREFPGGAEGSSEIIIEFVKAFENELSMKKTFSGDEAKIKEALGLLN